MLLAAVALQLWILGVSAVDEGDYCDYPTVSHSDLTREVFDEQYRQKQPIRIRSELPSIASGVASCGGWLVGLPTASGGKAGDLEVELGRPYGLAHYGDSGEAVKRMSLADYLFKFKYQEHDPWYLFDRKRLLHDSLPVLGDAVRGVPGMELHEGTSFPLILAVGHRDTGLPFHHHAETSNLLLCGAKEWHMYPPGDMPSTGYNPALPHTMFVSHFLPKATPRPVRCLQHPGDIIYVPAGWRHATVNAGEPHAVAVAAQNFGELGSVSWDGHRFTPKKGKQAPSSTIPLWWQHLVRAMALLGEKPPKAREASELLKKGTVLLPGEPQLWLQLARAQLALKQPTDALASLRKAWKLNPLDWNTVGPLLQTLTAFAKHSASDRERKAFAREAEEVRRKSPGVAPPGTMYPLRNPSRGHADQGEL